MGPPRRKTRDMSSWREAWTMYAAVIVAWNPQRAEELLAFHDTILSAFRQFRPAAVLAYNRSFCLLAEKIFPFCGIAGTQTSRQRFLPAKVYGILTIYRPFSQNRPKYEVSCPPTDITAHLQNGLEFGVIAL